MRFISELFSGASDQCGNRGENVTFESIRAIILIRVVFFLLQIELKPSCYVVQVPYVDGDIEL